MMEKEKLNNLETNDESIEPSDFEMVEQSSNEEVAVEEASPEETEPISYSSSYMENIEEARAHFLKIYRLHNTFKWIVMVIAMASMIIAFLVIPNSVPDNGMIITSAIAVGALALVIVYNFFTKRYINKKMREYFNLYYDNVNQFALGGEDVTNIKSQFPGKIVAEAFTDNNLFKNVTDVGSRGLTEFEYQGVPIAICDCAGQTRNEQKRIVPVFVGKYLYAASNYAYDEPLYVYIKGDKRALPPTNMQGMNAVIDENVMIVYTNNKDWKKVLNQPVKDILKSIKPNKELVDVSISLQKGRMFVCMGYDDPLMVLPLQNQFDPKPNEIFKQDVKNVLKLIKEFNK